MSEPLTVSAMNRVSILHTASASFAREWTSHRLNRFLHAHVGLTLAAGFLVLLTPTASGGAVWWVLYAVLYAISLSALLLGLSSAHAEADEFPLLLTQPAGPGAWVAGKFVALAQIVVLSSILLVLPALIFGDGSRALVGVAAGAAGVSAVCATLGLALGFWVRDGVRGLIAAVGVWFGLLFGTDLVLLGFGGVPFLQAHAGRMGHAADGQSARCVSGHRAFRGRAHRLLRLERRSTCGLVGKPRMAVARPHSCRMAVRHRHVRHARSAAAGRRIIDRGRTSGRGYTARSRRTKAAQSAASRASPCPVVEPTTCHGIPRPFVLAFQVARQIDDTAVSSIWRAGPESEIHAAPKQKAVARDPASIRHMVDRFPKADTLSAMPPPRFTALPFFVYPVSDMSRARAFYEGVLGLVVSANWENKWVEFDIGAGTLALSSVMEGSTPGARGGAAALEAENFDAAVDYLRAHHVPFAFEPADTSVCKFARFLDPDGNHLVLHRKHTDWEQT